MKWKKRGQLFDPTSHQFQDFDCNLFAQSPQAIVFDDYVRIYFSTRKVDSNNQFLSIIRYLDFSKDFLKIYSYSVKEIIDLGELGTFDEHGIFPFSPIKIDDKIFAYTCGWSRRISVPVETSTGYVVSYDNGHTFQRIGKGPVLTSSLNETCLVGDSFVKFFEGKFHMWYIFGKKWLQATVNEPAVRVYKIAYASSDDGINWLKNESKQIITDVINEFECQALPSVEFHNGIYHMVFCYRFATDFRNNPERAYRLGYASSIDLINWERDDSKLSSLINEDSWDSEMKCYPNLFVINNQLHLLYNGNNFGKFGFGLATLQE